MSRVTFGRVTRRYARTVLERLAPGELRYWTSAWSSRSGRRAGVASAPAAGYRPLGRSPPIVGATSAVKRCGGRPRRRPTRWMPNERARRSRLRHLVAKLPVMSVPLARSAASRRNSSWRAFASRRSPSGITTDSSDLDRFGPARRGASSRRDATRRARGASRQGPRAPRGATSQAVAPEERADQRETCGGGLAAKGKSARGPERLHLEESLPSLSR
jgi:hypothetical protein